MATLAPGGLVVRCNAPRRGVAFVGGTFPGIFVGGGASDHPRAHDLAELDGCESDASAGTEYEKRFSRLKLRAVEQRVIGGAVDHRQRGGCRCVYGAFECEGGVRFHRNLLR